ncbi:MAG TPA: ATP-binding protein [Myxococcaceae bacterium]
MGTLADFLTRRRDEVVERFKERVGGSLSPDGLTESDLRNHLPAFLGQLSLALREETWPPSARVFSHNATAEQHGRQRLDVGFSLDALTREYGLLHDCILELLEEAGERPTLRELRLLAGCIAGANADSVTQYVHYQQALLRESEERLQAILDNAPAAVYVKDVQGRWLIVNRRMEALFGRTREELVGQSDEQVLAPAVVARIHATDAQVLARNEPLESEEELPLADGPHTYLSLKFPLRDSEGRPTGVCGISTDITERRRVQDFHQRLLGIVGHDIRGPLSAITLSAATLLGQVGLSPAQVRSLQRISRSAERIERLVALLLDFTRAQLGLTLPLRPAPVCMASLCERVLDEVQAAHPGRPLHLDSSGDTCGEWDPDRLMQVLGNLVSNAVRYSPSNAPVEVRIHGDAHAVTLQVHNGGAPIPDEARPTLFLPFRRGEKAAAVAREGMGLGLYIVREVVKAHEGTITVDSSAEDGTTFTVLLPRHLPGVVQAGSARGFEELGPDAVPH